MIPKVTSSILHAHNDRVEKYVAKRSADPSRLVGQPMKITEVGIEHGF